MSFETAPAPKQAENLNERFPHLAVPGFDKLAPDRQMFFESIPPDKFHLVRPSLEKEISKVRETTEKADLGETKTYQARTIENIAQPRKEQANTAIETFRRAKAGDPNAKKDLLDQKRELLGEQPSDDDIFQTMLEDQSGLFDNSLVLEVALSDSETPQHQDVLDLYKEFRGNLANVDEAISPEQQIDLFIKITKGGGTLPNLMFLARKALTVLTDNGRRNLSLGLKETGVLVGGELSDDGILKLRETANSSAVKAEYA